MATLVVPNAYAATLNWHRGGAFAAQNTFGIRRSDGAALNQGAVDAFAAAVKAAFLHVDSLQDATGSSWSIEQLKVLDLQTATSPFFIAQTGANGTLSADTIPNQCAVVTSFTTALRGRSFRGRVYVPGCPDSAQSQGQVTTGIASNHRNFWGLVDAGLNAVDVTLSLGVISRKKREIHTVTGISSSTRVYTQRRRSYR